MSRPFRSERHAALDAVYPTTCNGLHWRTKDIRGEKFGRLTRGITMAERFCCDGICNENQGRGGCPRFCDCVENVPNVQESPINSGELAICGGFVVVCLALPFIVGPWLWPYLWGVFA